jgi:hypothetical protein
MTPTTRFRVREVSLRRDIPYTERLALRSVDPARRRDEVLSSRGLGPEVEAMATASPRYCLGPPAPRQPEAIDMADPRYCLGLPPHRTWR